MLARTSLQNKRMTVPDLAASWSAAVVTTSKTTVRRRLQDAGLHGHLAVKKPLLTARHRCLHLEFAREHLHWNWVDWSVVLWTDESCFTMVQSDGPTFVRRRPGEQLRNDCVVPTVKFDGGSIMMWGAMSFRGTGFLTRVELVTLTEQGTSTFLVTVLCPQPITLAMVTTSSYRMMVLHVTGRRLLMTGKMNNALGQLYDLPSHQT